MWLLPVFFMIHDFEEIIVFERWIGREGPRIRERFPRFGGRLLARVSGLSTSSFAIAVSEEFVLLSILTAVFVESGNYEAWAGLLLGFGIHLVVHIGQGIAYRRYVPGFATCFPCLLYCAGALLAVDTVHRLTWSRVAVWTLAALIIIAVNLAAAHALAAFIARHAPSAAPSESDAGKRNRGE
jgi:hypothetical protein